MNKNYALPTFISVVAYISLLIGVCLIFVFLMEFNSTIGISGLTSMISFPFLLGFSKIVKAACIYIDLHSRQIKQEATKGEVNTAIVKDTGEQVEVISNTGDKYRCYNPKTMLSDWYSKEELIFN